MLAHRLLGGSSSSVSISCPSLESKLIAVAHTRPWNSLGGALPSVGRQGRNPLSLSIPKQWSLASSADPDFFPDFLLASCGALTPFRLCSRSQPQSFPWDLTSEAQAQASAPSPHPPQWVSRQASQPGECWLALIFCTGISPLCPLHPYCCALLHGSKASPTPTLRLRQ